jgi:hypothetical protein
MEHASSSREVDDEYGSRDGSVGTVARLWSGKSRKWLGIYPAFWKSSIFLPAGHWRIFSPMLSGTGTQRRRLVDSLPASYSRGCGFESLRSIQASSGIVPSLFNDHPTVKVNLSPCLFDEAPRHEDVWGSGGISSPFLTSTLYGGEWSASRFSYFTP